MAVPKLITSRSQVSDKALVEIKTWLEQWGTTRKRIGSTAQGGGEHDLYVVFDASGSTLTTGVKGDVRVDFPCSIKNWSILGDQSGSIVVDIWKDVYASYPPTVADTITASAKPTATTATHASSTSLTGWTTSIQAGDTLRFNIDSVSTFTRVTLILHLQE